MTKKNYPLPEEIPSNVNEPQAAYGLNADHLRMEMMREVLRINDTNLLRKALDYIRDLGEKQTTECPPCQYTLEELNKRLDIAEEEARQGLGLTTEELRKKHPRWNIS
ncbi:hypothetical protein AALM74_24090 [Parabacteroides segnis]|mgnify:CR=1 FL=1|jgi:hypothetical protein|uniref:Uncharacterized protein n=1 Tax=Parabacteroides segnis TaxID=2763058 RepID=A0ABR7E7S5_9BACT|nr:MULTISPECIES: hypothetical protein [Parabacteroides]MBC5645802.1 hypothetical protein [Parabacteroides segnis]MCM0715542.1 hypothetical protein [Parabacteroides sp. TA-V-105]